MANEIAASQPAFKAESPADLTPFSINAPATPASTTAETTPSGNSVANKDNAPNEPSRTASFTEDESVKGGAEADHPKNAPKMPACAECKRLKVKCVRSEPDNYMSNCLRCIKKNLACITGLNAKKPKQFDRPRYLNGTARTRRFDELQKVQTCSVSMRDRLLESWKVLTSRDDLRLQLLERYDYTSLAKTSNNVSKRGLLSHSQVEERINLYRRELYPKFPIIECPPYDQIEDFMNDCPVLFHTILDVAGQLIESEKETETSIVLHNMVQRTVIDEIMVVSVKSIELLKCLILLTQWYNESELYHQQRLHVLTALAVSMSYDLGMGGATVITNKSDVAPFEQMVTPHGSSDGYSIENLKLWIAVYSSLFQNLMANRRPVKSHWNKYTEWAVEVLRNICLEEHQADGVYPPGDSPVYSYKSDLHDGLETGLDQSRRELSGGFDIWELAKVRHLQETIVLAVFKKQNETVAIDLNEPEGQYTVHQLSLAIDDLQKSFLGPSLRRRVAIALTRTLLHQAVLYSRYHDSLGRAPFTNFSLNIFCGPLSPQAVESFRECVRNAVLFLDTIIKRDRRDLVSEMCNIWSCITLCCDILLKCRICAVFNRHFATAFFVTEEHVGRVHQTIEMLDTISKEFPFCNNAISFGFFIKLLLCHHDARQFHYAVKPVDAGDPEFIKSLLESSESNIKRRRKDDRRASNLMVRPENPSYRRVSETKGRQMPNQAPARFQEPDGMAVPYSTGPYYQGNVANPVNTANAVNIAGDSTSTEYNMPANGDMLLNVPDNALPPMNNYPYAYVDPGANNMGMTTPINTGFQPDSEKSYQASPEEAYSWGNTPTLDESPVFDTQALNYIESFWGDFTSGIEGDGIRNDIQFPM